MDSAGGSGSMDPRHGYEGLCYSWASNAAGQVGDVAVLFTGIHWRAVHVTINRISDLPSITLLFEY